MNFDEKFDAAFEKAIGESKDLGKTLFKKFAEQAGDDAQEFLDEIKESLKKATGFLAEGRIDNDDFEDLVRGKRDLAMMHALKQKGLAKATIDTFVNGIVNIFIDAVFSLF